MKTGRVARPFSISFDVHHFSLTADAIVRRFDVCVSSPHRLAVAESRNALHRELLRVFSPQLYHRMVELQMEPEFYAWDWFVQLFMSLFSVPQSAILVDLLLSVNDGDLILICLSVALIGELRPIIMHVGFAEA